MSVLIPGMEMPTEGGTIVVYKISGKYFAARAGKDELFPISPVPDHGRLIDADALIDDMANMIPWVIESPEEIAMVDGLSAGYEAVKAAPTIIPADKEGEG